MAITPKEIKNVAFSPAQGEAGYNPAEVDKFLDRVADEVDKLMKRVVELKTRYTQAEGRAQAIATEATGLRQQLASQEQSRLNGQLSETQLSEVFVIAKQTADKMISDADEKAKAIIADAESRANDTIRQALADKQKEIDELNHLQQARANYLNVALEAHEQLRNYLEQSAMRVPLATMNVEGIDGISDMSSEDEGYNEADESSNVTMGATA